MDQVSAFAAYKNAQSNQNSKKKQKKPNSNTNSRPVIVLPTHTKKAKRNHTDTFGAGPSQTPKKRVAAEAVTPNSAPRKMPKQNGNTVRVEKNTSTNAWITSQSSQSSQPSQSSRNTNGFAFQAPEPSGQSKITSVKKVTAPTSNANGAGGSGRSNDSLMSSSVENGQLAFQHLISGVTIKKFMAENFEKQPLYIERANSKHYENLKVSTQTIDEMLRSNIVEFTKNIDITSYENGVRETHNPDGRALPATVWDFYRLGRSIRLLNPATFMSSLNKFNATLQEYFHCLVGANIYLTPPGSQGFAPHYDDIEAFVLQIEGTKEWSLYPPRTENETLPRESSGNFQQDEIGEPVHVQILKPGDLLYFPRGWIHQAKTVDNSHSLHITLSVYQKNSYADLIEELMKQALKTATENDVTLRRGVPLDIWSHLGYTYSDYNQSPRRNQLKDVVTNMVKSLINHLDLDGAVDRMAIKFQHDALPPVLSASEKVRTTFGTKPVLRHNGQIEMPDMYEDTEIRLVRANICHLAKIDDAYNLYYYADNSKEYHAYDSNFIEVEDAAVDVIKKLIQLYPKYIQIKNLDDDIDSAMGIVYSLFDRGLLMTKNPLE